MMLYKPNLYDADYRNAEKYANTLFTSSSNAYMLEIARSNATYFRGVEIDTLFDAYTANPMRERMFVEIVDKLVQVDALNAAQTERFHRIVTAEK